MFVKIFLPLVFVFPLISSAQEHIGQAAYDYLSGKTNGYKTKAINNESYVKKPSNLGPVLSPFFDKNNVCQLWGNGWFVLNAGMLTPNVESVKDRNGYGSLLISQKQIGQIKVLDDNIKDFNELRSYRNTQVKVPVLSQGRISDTELNRHKNAMSALILACGGTKHLFD